MTDSTQYVLVFDLMGALIVLLLYQILLLRRKIGKQQERLKMFNLICHHMIDLLTTIRWHTELIENEDFGKLKVAQKDILHKVKTGVTDAVRLNHKFLVLTGKYREKSLDADAKHAAEAILEKNTGVRSDEEYCKEEDF